MKTLLRKRVSDALQIFGAGNCLVLHLRDKQGLVYSIFAVAVPTILRDIAKVALA